MTDFDHARILTVVSKFSAEFYRRWRSVKGEIREAIVEKDILDLAGEDDGDGRLITDGGRPDSDPYRPSGFEFTTDAGKISGFMEWYQDLVRSKVLKPVGDRVLRRGGHWTAKYLRSANTSGIRDAGTHLRKRGVTPLYSRGELENMFNLPMRTDMLATLYMRAFRELKGITEAVGQQISRELTDALAQGENPRKVASRINDRVDAIGLTRSRTLARTELARSYNHGSLLRYARNGIEEVEILNQSPCEQCEPFVGPVYTLEEAMGILPIHPNCLGTWVPVIPSLS